MFENIDLKKELLKERSGRVLPERSLLDQVHELLNTTRENDEDIYSRLKKGRAKNTSVENILVFENDHPNIFALEQIKNVCVNYRLRFLDSKHFKGEYPYEAIIKIKEFEKRNSCEIKEFKIMAPAKMFRLIDPDQDPLLFANTGSGNFYLIHKWGNDLAWHRKFLTWPIKNLKNIVFTLLALSLLITLLLPNAIFMNEGKTFGQVYLGKMIFFLLFTMGSFAFTLRTSLRRNKNLSELDWENKYMY